MSDSVSFLTLLLIGFLGGGHCVAMCGGLSSAFALQLPERISRVKLIVLLNLGRISGYVFIGVLLGALGQLGLSLDKTRTLQMGLFVFANVLLILLGLYVAGLSQWIIYAERLGKPIWQRLNPILNRLLPIQSLSACVGVGFLWGWLPCGLVYSASLYALSSGDALSGGLNMAAFGLGTLPNLLAMGVFAAQLKDWLNRRKVRLAMGLLLVCWALWQLKKIWF
ncbi:sulfite exporter TauE/SafE family protein [Stenoxybacter acetivorans]|uniref:sulfite exporter TauE/SafE family protein n=1 Tax=Stenoxybacter acetivorans TaxID=422441 RepID=UPI00056B5095|nr:sulfite exporter TauE/SafE family protein [Stenoxybacter acetivorans]